VRGQNYGYAPLSVYTLNKPSHCQFGNGIQSDCRLIEKQYRRRVQQRGSDIASHSLPQTKLSDRRSQQRFKAKHRDEFISRGSIGELMYGVNIAKKIERFDNGQIPPELGSLTENNSNAAHMLDAILPRDSAGYNTPTGGWD
jgi:hypothetical protein